MQQTLHNRSYYLIDVLSAIMIWISLRVGGDNDSVCNKCLFTFFFLAPFKTRGSAVNFIVRTQIIIWYRPSAGLHDYSVSVFYSNYLHILFFVLCFLMHPFFCFFATFSVKGTVHHVVGSWFLCYLCIRLLYVKCTELYSCGVCLYVVHVLILHQ